VSASWLVCTLTLDRWVPKRTPLRCFRLPPAQPLRLALVDPTDRYLRAWKPVPLCPQYNHYVCFPASSPSFSLFLFQRPPAPPSRRNDKQRSRSWELEPNPTVIREAHREEDSTRDNGKRNNKTETNHFGVRTLYAVRDQDLPAGANFDTDRL
jgi:hypothetical protein